MNKLIFAMVFIFSTALAGAAAIDNASLNIFSNGKALSSKDMNDNFTVIKDAVNANAANTASLPVGVDTTRTFLISKPVDLTAGTVNVTPLFSGCSSTLGDTNVPLSFTQRGLKIGENGLFIFSLISRTLTVPQAVGAFTTIVVTTEIFTLSTITDLQSISIRRLGESDAANDDCSDTLTLQGILIDYPTLAGTRRLFLRGSESQ